MINWTIIEGDGPLPGISDNDVFRKAQQYSDRVLVLVEKHNEDDRSFAFGTYIHSINSWNIEGYSGKWKVIAWAYLNHPF